MHPYIFITSARKDHSDHFSQSPFVAATKEKSNQSVWNMYYLRTPVSTVGTDPEPADIPAPREL